MSKCLSFCLFSSDSVALQRVSASNAKQNTTLISFVLIVEHQTSNVRDTANLRWPRIQTTAGLTMYKLYI